MTLKLTKALAATNLADTCRIPVGDGFVVHICESAAYNQSFLARVAKFKLQFPEHPVADAKNPFWADLLRGVLTPDTEAYLCHVVVAGWELVDDDGKDVPFSPELFAEEILSTPSGRVIANKLLLATAQPRMFELEQTTKN